MSEIKAIQTEYNGYRFRSRLEARWAVFFDTLGVAYQYEPEGFDLGTAGNYLPDFWFPKQQCFIEIKDQKPTEQEEQKASALATVSNKDVFIFFGDCWAPDYNKLDGAYRYPAAGGWDNHYAWCECYFCPEVGIRFEGRSARLPCGHAQEKDPTADKNYNDNSDRIKNAFAAARQARFEHGEKPFVRNPKRYF